jgi:hypothetical protein
MSKKLKAQLKIWYAKHPPSRKRGATKSSGSAAKDSDDERCQRLRVYNNSASDDENPNGSGKLATQKLLHRRLWAAPIDKHVVSADWLRALLYDCDRLAACKTAAAIH